MLQGRRRTKSVRAYLVVRLAPHGSELEWRLQVVNRRQLSEVTFSLSVQMICYKVSHLPFSCTIQKSGQYSLHCGFISQSRVKGGNARLGLTLGSIGGITGTLLKEKTSA